MAKIGIIGGSGLDNPEILSDPYDKDVSTPYGNPSAPLKIGKINNIEVILLARHGRKHEIPPSQVNYRANIFALKQENCTHIISTTAVGSLKEGIKRGDLVILDQFIDFTKQRKLTFHETFNDGPKHTSMANPFDENLRKILVQTSKELGFNTHEKGTVITIEGPRFSTKAESHMFRLWGADVINMSITPEVILANELKIPYAAIAMSTDYDCWKDDEEPVSCESIQEIFIKNSDNVKALLINILSKLAEFKRDNLKSKIRTIANFPKQGVVFRDITTLLKDPEGLRDVVSEFKNRYKNTKIDKIAGIESRGFILASILAHEFNVGFIPIRKKGKLPYEVESHEYELEYGKDTIEIHRDAIDKGDHILLTDDLIATGGTSLAACKLIEKLGGNIVEVAVIIDLPDLNGRKKLQENGYKTFALVEFMGH